MGKNFLGIDVGATKTVFLAARFKGADFEILDFLKTPTPRRGKEILGLAEKNFKKFNKDKKISGIGIGFAGPVDFKAGAAVLGPNLKTGRIDFKKVLEKETGVPVVVDNDAHCFVLAESVFGQARGKKIAIGVTVGTGLGVGIIIGGRIYRGANNFAGEFGHTNIEKSREWEDLGSGSGLSRVYRRLTDKKADSFKILELAKKKNKGAREAVRSSAQYLGIGLANIMEIFNPEIVVLGGGLAKEDLIVNEARRVARKKVFLPSLAKTPVARSSFCDSAVALGAAWMSAKAR